MEMYKKQDCFWRAEEMICLKIQKIGKLNDSEKHFIKMIFAFFSI